MIVGSGLIAGAFRSREPQLGKVCIYAAGVSNSSCTDEHEYIRDRERLQACLAAVDPSMIFVYCSTCSVEDPWSRASRYVAHKRDLEEIAKRCCTKTVIARISQVAGNTPNPHTILNYLYARIARSERFDLWAGASRNIIDAEHVASILADMVANEELGTGIVNIASPLNTTIREIVAAFERITNRRAIYNLLEKGGWYPIDTAPIASSVERLGIRFDESYLMRTLSRYYGHTARLSAP